jgi:Fe-S cluster assembly protein SufD
MTTLLEQLQNVSVDATAPQWLQNKQSEALKHFQTKGFPAQSDEAWKYVDIENVISSAASLVSESAALPEEQAGLKVSALLEANAENNFSTGIDQTVFSFLNTLHCKDGVHLHVTGTVANTIRFDSSPTRLVIVVEPGAKAEVYITDTNQTDSTNTMIDVTLKEGAELSIIRAAYKNSNVRFASFKADLYKDAQLYTNLFVQGSQLNRYDTQVNFHEEGADAQLRGVGLISGESQYYNHLLINHFSPGCTCKQEFKNILTDKAVTEFSGVVYVHKDSHETDSQQHNSNLLLSDNARALSRPQLIIDADDVECAHGSTIGQLNPEEIFYIKSRGLSEKEAKSLLTYGFAEEIIDYIETEDIHNQLESLLREEVSRYAES